MKEKIKEIFPILIVILIVLGLAFYWYEWRPTQIRSECAIRAQGDEGNQFNMKEFLAKQGVQNAIDELYMNCLREKGISK